MVTHIATEKEPSTVARKQGERARSLVSRWTLGRPTLHTSSGPPSWVARFAGRDHPASFDRLRVSSMRCRCRTPYAASLTAASSSRPDPSAPPMVAMDASSQVSVR